MVDLTVSMTRCWCINLYDGIEFVQSTTLTVFKEGALVAEWIKRWPTDLEVPSSSLAGGENLSDHKRGSIAHIFPLSPNHRPDMVEILLKGA